MSDVLLRVEDVSKFYGDVQVLSDISLDIGYNEIVGIAGENGAGKSSILKLIAGVTTVSGGAMALQDEPYQPNNYHAAVNSGVAMVFQEQALIGNLRVFENIFYGFEDHFPWLGPLLNHKAMRDQAQQQLTALGFGYIDATTLTDDLPFHHRQMVEIARAFILADHLKIDHPLILLDEPTAAIGENEVRTLFDVVRRLKDKASFIIVTHKLSEYIELCDRLYVFKDGAVAGELVGESLIDTEVHRLMVGRTRDAALYHEDLQRNEFGETRLCVSHLTGGLLSDVNLTVRGGEILGVGGLIGCGKEELVRAIVGHRPHAEEGDVTLCGQSLPLRGRATLAKSLGLAYVPKERKTEGIVGYMSVASNISLASLDRVSKVPCIISPAREIAQANDYISRLSIECSGPEQDAVYLSGGNQQKLVLAKWLVGDISVILLDNPTRGVDVGAKFEIYRIIRTLAQTGVCVLLISDDLLELIGLSNRVMVMRAGEVSAQIDAPADAKPTETDIVRHMI